VEFCDPSSGRSAMTKPDVKHWGWTTWVWAAIALLALYPLSMGPAAWITFHSGNPTVAWIYNAAYLPLLRSCALSDPCWNALDWYLSLWVTFP
jgi:hypothetical protein